MNGPAVAVRPARREDWPRMAELYRELATFERLPLPTPDESERLRALIFDAGKIEALVVERNGRIEGMAIFWEFLGSSFRARPALFLEDLVVSESERSGGLGEALLAALAREGVRRGAMRLEWTVLDWNVNAIRFYRRIGAAPVQDWVRYALPEGEMRKLAASRP